jgi:DNA topoisomerase-1
MKKANLVYVDDETVPGIKRCGRPGAFFYRLPSGKKLTDPRQLARIASLAIPPAWRNVWIAPFAHAHLAATGRDAKGRKQYRYHPDFVAVRDAAKYAHLVEFAESLPVLRRKLAADLKKPGMPREKVLAVVVTLLEETLIRIGNEDYARANASYGLTTLRNHHVRVKGGELRFSFRGKSGRRWNLRLRDRRIAALVRRCQELPGQHLFEYRNDGGKVQSVSSADVNAYLKAVCRRPVSAKDFRTWAGTVEAALSFHALVEQEVRSSRRVLMAVIREVAERLGNTPSVCRKCYIHPAVVMAFEEGSGRLRSCRRQRGTGLSPAEKSVLALLKRARRQSRSILSGR